MPPNCALPQPRLPQVRQSQRFDVRSQSLHFASPLASSLNGSPSCLSSRVWLQGKISSSHALTSLCCEDERDFIMAVITEESWEGRAEWWVSEVNGMG